jgi:O-antigen/teichoic acid export membrane protein
MLPIRYVSWTLLDQTLVSGLNFLTGILLARFLGAEGYGQFVLLYAALLYANTLQAAIIILPMMSIFPSITGAEERRRYADGAFVLQFFLGVGSILLLMVLGKVLDYLHPEWHLKHYFLPVGAAVIFFQCQEWLRRYYFSGSRPAMALASDLIAYGGQFVVLVALYFAGALTVVTAFWAIAATSALALWFGWAKEHFRFHVADAPEAYRRSIIMARDFFLSAQAQWTGSQGVLMVAGAFLGAESSGGIRAAQNVVGPLNILYQAMENIVPIKAAEEFGRNKVVGLKRFLGKTSSVGGVAVLVPCLIIAGLSGLLMKWFYGAEYVQYSMLVVWQTVYMYLGFYYRQVTYFHRAMNTTTPIVFAAGSAALVSIAASLVLIPAFKESGLMAALILAQAIGIGVAGWAVYSVLREN